MRFICLPIVSVAGVLWLRKLRWADRFETGCVAGTYGKAAAASGEAARGLARGLPGLAQVISDSCAR